MRLPYRDPFPPPPTIYTEVHELDGSKRGWGMIIIIATAFFSLGVFFALIIATVPR